MVESPGKCRDTSRTLNRVPKINKINGEKLFCVRLLRKKWFASDKV